MDKRVYGNDKQTTYQKALTDISNLESKIEEIESELETYQKLTIDSANIIKDRDKTIAELTSNLGASLHKFDNAMNEIEDLNQIIKNLKYEKLNLKESLKTTEEHKQGLFSQVNNLKEELRQVTSQKILLNSTYETTMKYTVESNEAEIKRLSERLKILDLTIGRTRELLTISLESINSVIDHSLFPTAK